MTVENDSTALVYDRAKTIRMTRRRRRRRRRRWPAERLRSGGDGSCNQKETRPPRGKLRRRRLAGPPRCSGRKSQGGCRHRKSPPTWRYFPRQRSSMM
jgi:ribosomal protein L24E